MKHYLLKKTLICAAFSGWASVALAAGLTVAPATITNDYGGKITLTITGLASGKTVLVEKYGDLNTNGVIDAGEPLFQSSTITDGQLPLIGGVRNLNVPGDKDGATNGQIRVELFYPGIVPILDFIAGTYLFKVYDPAGSFTAVTNSFVVKQKSYPQGVIGRLTIAGTGAPLAYAIVVLALPNRSAVTGGVTDANGNYTLYGPPGGFAVVPVRPGFVADIDAGGVLIPSNQVVSKNLALAAATRTISGQVRDSATGSGLGGVLVRGEAGPNLFAGVFSAAAGHFVLPVSAALWDVRVDRGQLAQQGYVGWDEGATADTSGGSVANLNFESPKASALIFGTLSDPQNQPVAGFAVGAKQHDAYEAAGRAFASNANFCLGVIAGAWRVEADSDELYSQGLWSQQTSVNIANGQAVQANLTLQRLTARLVGRVVDDTGAPVANLDFGVSDHQGADFYPGTDGNGNFDIGVLAGAWHFHIDSDDAWQRRLVGQDLTVTITNGETKSNLTYVARRATAQISGQVQDDLGQPMAGAWVWASANLNGTNYSPGNETDGNGHYQLGVFNALWQVGVDCNPFTSRGLNCPSSQSTNVAGANVVVNFTATDATPPALVASTPADNQTGVATNAVIAFTFNEPMQSGYSISISWGGEERYNFAYAWTADGKTLIYTKQGAFPPNTAIVWTLNPGGWIGSNFRDVSGNPLPGNISGSFTTGNTGFAPDVNYYVVGKHRSFQQTNTSPPVLQTNQPFMFFAFVYPNSAFAVTSSTLALPGGGIRPLSFTGYLDSLGILDPFASQSALNAAYPAGTYTMTLNTTHDGVRTAALSLGGDAYPAAPRVSNFTAAQAINPAADFTVTWDAFAGGTSNDFIQLQVQDALTDQTVFATPPASRPGAFNGLVASAMIPGHTLQPARNYSARLLFAKVTATNVTSYPGVPGVVAFDSETAFPLRTVTPPLGVAVTPASITNDYVGKIALTITGLTPGQAVLIEKYGDLNGNGVIDAGEPVLQGGMLIDGALPIIGGVRNLNVPGDEDGAANGQIRMELFYPGTDKGLDVIAGKYLAKVSDPNSGFAPITSPFEVKQKVFPQGVNGRLTAFGTSTPLANAMVLMMPPDSNPVTGTVTDANGNYTLYGPPGNYVVGALKSGYVGDFNGIVTVSANSTATTNLALPSATRTISGKLKDSSSGVGIPGVFIQVESSSGQFVSAFSDSAGNYSVGVLADSWTLRPSSGSLSQLGYLRWQNKTNVNATSGNVGNLDLPVDQATALIYGTVKNSQNNPVIGVDIHSNDQPNRQYSASGTTFPPNADYCVGVRPGNWGIGPDSDSLSALGYTGQGTNVTVTAGQAVRVDFILGQVNAHLIGRVVDDASNGIGNIGFSADNHQGSYIRTTTDANGNFDLAVFGGTWDLNIPTEEARPRGYFTTNLTVTVANGETRSGLTFVAQRAAAHLRGRLVDNTGAGVGNIQFGAYNNSLSLWLWTQTDASGNFDIGVIAGSWSLNISGGDAQARSLMGPNLPAFNVVNGVDQNNILVVAQRTTAQVSGWVRNSSSSPVTNLFVWIGTSVNGTNYGNGSLTDSNGHYQFSVFNGSWQVGLNCGGNQSLQSQGYLCVDPVGTNVTGASVGVNFVVQPAAPPVITTASLPNGAVGSSYSTQLNASGGTPPYSWSLAPGSASLASGLTLAANGLISGTPTQSGTNYFFVRVTDNLSNTADQLLSITIPALPLQVTTSSLPNGFAGVAYTGQLQASGGQTPYTWSLALGSAPLPGGLTISSGGVISGTPTTAATNTFIVRVTDSASQTTTKLLTMVLNATLPRLSITYPNANSVAVRWPLPADGFALEETISLSGTISWQGVGTTPVVVDGQSVVTLPIQSGQHFFRLRKP